MSDAVVLAGQFDDTEQQREAVGLGMWTFLVTEVMFFGGLFAAYTVYRSMYPAAFHEAGRHLYAWIGIVNTAVLLTSSVTMVLAVQSARRNARRRLLGFLGATVALGLVFLGFKALEYTLDVRAGILPGAHFRASDFHDPTHVQVFYLFYWIMTGIHAIHMIAGIGVVTGFAIFAAASPPAARHQDRIDTVGLYWHFVDIIWIFLLPLLYLAS